MYCMRNTIIATAIAATLLTSAGCSSNTAANTTTTTAAPSTTISLAQSDTTAVETTAAARTSVAETTASSVEDNGFMSQQSAIDRMKNGETIPADVQHLLLDTATLSGWLTAPNWGAPTMVLDRPIEPHSRALQGLGENDLGGWTRMFEITAAGAEKSTYMEQSAFLFETPADAAAFVEKWKSQVVGVDFVTVNGADASAAAGFTDNKTYPDRTGRTDALAARGAVVWWLTDWDPTFATGDHSKSLAGVLEYEIRNLEAAASSVGVTIP